MSVGSAGVEVGAAVNVGSLVANAVGFGGMFRVGAGAEVGSLPQARDTNKTADKTSSGIWTFKISSLVQASSQKRLVTRWMDLIPASAG